jgi:hypothetical protein
MSRRAITREIYETLLNSFRKARNMSQVAREAGVDARTASKAWNKGFPEHTWAIPIKIALEQEAEAIRAGRIAAAQRQQEEEEKRAIKAREDAIETQLSEAMIVSSNRKLLSNVIAGVVIPLVTVAPELARKITADIQGNVFSPMQRVAVAKEITSMMKATGEITRMVLEAERLRLGQPTQVMGVQIQDLTAEQAANELANMVGSIGSGALLANEVTGHVKNTPTKH